MCGIAGIVSREPERLIGPMLESVEHRGRDDQGVWVSEEIDSSGRRACLGHRRLAIIDTSPGGHEPMFSHDGRYVLTFNGEIYNYREPNCVLAGTSFTPIAMRKFYSPRSASGVGTRWSISTACLHSPFGITKNAR
jgi:asparagine synthase (glutamine-hydrolysing)